MYGSSFDAESHDIAFRLIELVLGVRKLTLLLISGRSVCSSVSDWKIGEYSTPNSIGTDRIRSLAAAPPGKNSCERVPILDLSFSIRAV